MHANGMSGRRFLLVQSLLLGGVIGLTPTVSFAKEKGPTSYLGRQFRDPTINPLVAKPILDTPQVVREVVQPPSLTIQGVIWGADDPRAIIDEQVVSKGDILPEGIEILDISSSGVKILYRGRIFTLFPEGVVEQR